MGLDSFESWDDRLLIDASSLSLIVSGLGDDDRLRFFFKLSVTEPALEAT